MIIIGELINASRKRIATAIKNADAKAIQNIAQDEWSGGANFIDVNAGVFEDKEVEYLPWLVKTVQEAVDGPCCIDSPNPKALEAALEVHRGDSPPLINSISLESERYEAVLPLVRGTSCNIVALCMSDKGMPEETKDRVKIAEELITKLIQNDVKMDNIYVDLLVQPVSTNGQFGVQYLRAVAEISRRFPEVHTICGLSNVSYGLPKRKLLNRAFASMAVSSGQDAFICDPLDRLLMSDIYASDALVGRDEYCERYLNAFREERLES